MVPVSIVPVAIVPVASVPVIVSVPFSVIGSVPVTSSVGIVPVKAGRVKSGRVLFGSRVGNVILSKSGNIVVVVSGTPAGHSSFQMAEPTPIPAPKTAPRTPMTINILMMKKPESSSSCGGGGGGLYPWSTDDFRDELRDDLRLLRLLALKTIKNFGRF